ncbi:MAG: sucrose-phosphate synthase [Gammaproteobacteria bacterium]
MIRRLLDPLPGLKIQPAAEQSQFKISYYIDPAKAPSLQQINQLLHQEEQSTNVIMSFGQYLDVLPLRASKGLALRYVAKRWDIPLDRILVISGSDLDDDMLRGNTLAAVVRAQQPQERAALGGFEQIYFADATGPGGILEAIEHYGFFDDLRDEASEEA